MSQQQGINNRRQNYENLKVLSERAMALFAASRPGTSYLDVQRAQQNLLNAENSLIDSINQYQNSLDNFKIALGMPVEADLEIVPVELAGEPAGSRQYGCGGTGDEVSPGSADGARPDRGCPARREERQERAAAGCEADRRGPGMATCPATSGIAIVTRFVELLGGGYGGLAH